VNYPYNKVIIINLNTLLILKRGYNTMDFIKGKDDHEILLLDSMNNILGKGYMYEFMESEILEKDKINYYIYAVPEVAKNENIIKSFIVDELIRRAKKQRADYPHCDARVYHCCFSDNLEQITFYSSIEGFKHDEGLHLLTCNLNNIKFNMVSNIGFDIKEDCLNSEEEIQAFIKEHKKVFRGNPYNIEKIKNLKAQEGFKNIAIFDKECIIGNIFLVVQEEETRYGLIEDLFVNKSYRNYGLGQYLLIRALDYFKLLGLDESRVEVWSSNNRASKLYYKVGYKFEKELEASIGMEI
jgi:GNAT superfamily N-acetyltransferase